MVLSTQSKELMLLKDCGCLGTWSNPVLSWDIPEYPCDNPTVHHPGSKGTEIFHARNFRVQPQANMGSGIVEYVV